MPMDIINQGRTLRISDRHSIYGHEFEKFFDFYFNAVENQDGLVDYSKAKFHNVRGFDVCPVYINSVAEGIESVEQYIDYAQLKPGDVVFDLGAYSGFTSIMFKQAVGATGTVVAVEADSYNATAVEKTLSAYQTATGLTVELVKAAVWNSVGTATFHGDGSQGSAVVDHAYGNQIVETVPTVTLSSLAEQFNLTHVDFIKCDIEGAERVIFEDQEFFKKYNPTLLIEIHGVPSIMRAKVESDLSNLGYTFESIKQTGFEDLPLIGCRR